MQVDDQDIREFAGIWKLEFNEDLSDDEARHHASQLLELFWLLARPLPSEEAVPVHDKPLT